MKERTFEQFDVLFLENIILNPIYLKVTLDTLMRDKLTIPLKEPLYF